MSASTVAQQTERINASVGRGGTNEAGDVRVVQDLLNRAASSGLAVDGVCGPRTIQAIVDYQKGFLRDPDGRVDPGGTTFRRLVGDRRASGDAPQRTPDRASGPTDGLRLVALPQNGRGYYSYKEASTQYGTQTLIDVLTTAGRGLHDRRLIVGVGHLSYEQGGNMPPHKTHRAGKHADLRPLRVGGDRGPTRVGTETYDREGTRTLVDLLLGSGQVKRILFNDEEISGVRFYPGHHDHLHVEVS